MGSEYKESKDNPLHREYGIWSNTVYILRKMWQYKSGVLFLVILGIVCDSVLSYFWGIFGKYVIDIIQMGLGGQEGMRQLARLMLVAGSINLVLNFGRALSDNRVWYNLILIRMNMLTERIAKVLTLRYELIERPDVLDIAERATRATNSDDNGVQGMMQLMRQVLTNAFTLVVTFASILILDYRLIIALIILGLMQFLYYRKIVKVDKEEVWDKMSSASRKSEYMTRITQDFDFAKDIRLFGLSDFLSGKQEEVNKETIEKMDIHRDLWYKHALVVQIAYVIIKGLIYATLFVAVFKKNLSISDFTMFLSLAMAFSSALLNFLQRFGDYKKASLEVDDFRSFLSLDLDMDESMCIPIPEADNYEIEFKNVSYKYYKADNYSLKNLNLKINAGEKLAVVGLNGAGKTTMIKLLLRLYEPTEGSITLNGIDIRKFKREDYYKLFAPVFQNIEIFAFNIAENIAMLSGDDLDKEKARNCAIEAGLEEKIASLVKGIDTPLTNIMEDDGIDMSGGERQKLALARALYKGGKFVVLDEPSSALDAIAEQKLYERFDEMIGKKSAVYISHRLASTRFCDRIAMFENGSLVELGTHEQLMEQNGKYAEMFNVQAQYYREDETAESEVKKVG